MVKRLKRPGPINGHSMTSAGISLATLYPKSRSIETDRRTEVCKLEQVVKIKLV